MRKNVCTTIFAATVAVSGNCLALTPITEEFESSRIDSVRWYQHRESKGKLSQDGGVLNFQVLAKPARSNFASIELMASAPGYAESWEMTLDISNTSTLARTAGIGFMIFNSVDRNDRLFVEYHGAFGINSGVFADGKYDRAAEFSKSTGITKGGIRVAFSKKTKLLTLFLSKTLSGEGYEWRKVGSFSPTGVGGDVRAIWDMGEDSSFGIQLYGTAGNTSIPIGNLTIDNFAISSSL
jgi:hypothetical protein